MIEMFSIKFLKAWVFIKNILVSLLYLNAKFYPCSTIWWNLDKKGLRELYWTITDVEERVYGVVIWGIRVQVAASFWVCCRVRWNLFKTSIWTTAPVKESDIRPVIGFLRRLKCDKLSPGSSINIKVLIKK